MKQKLTTLLFGLLLAVGWTSSAFAQTSPNNIPDAVYPKSYYDALTYTWDNGDGQGPRTSKSTDLATDPYQIYELLRFVYGNPAFPGPKYGAYTSAFVREDPIEYGPIQGGWNITAPNTANRNITILVTNGVRNGMMWNTYYATQIQSIEVKSGDNVITSWSLAQNGNSFPSSWTTNQTLSYNATNGIYYNNMANGTITIPASELTGYNNIEVVIYAKAADNSYRGSISVNNTSWSIPSTTSTDHTWSLSLPAEPTFVQGTVIPPYVEGYTALMVSVYDDATAASESGTGITGDRTHGSYFNTKQGYINYIAQRIKSVQLLTDGLRIGSADEHTSGTVFNCSGTYNKFFIISKGQAREKSDYTKNNLIGNYANRWYYGEVFPFQTMYEQFSPTTVDKGADIKDFYTEMQDGHVYSVVHDCASVIQEGHQFSMSGNNGTQSYAMSGLNFFIPDYRLLFWTDTYQGYTIDGRDINPYMRANNSGHTTAFDDGSYWSCWFGNYNPDYAPKVGIYKITLEANAKKAAGYDINDPYYDVTLNWVSSLNELSGEMVPQTYEIYIVKYNEDGTETQELLVTVTDETTYTYQVKQEDVSKTITYIIKGYPTPGNEQEYPSFVAWSNLDDVVIPGLNDFLNLILDHYESDFVIGNKIGSEKNYYRNFMHVAAENEDNALTLERINAGENLFTLYRYEVNNPQEPMLPIGELNFWDNHDGGKTAGYGFSFKQGTQDVESYDIHKPAAYGKDENNQEYLIHPAIDIDSAYSYDKLGMPINHSGFELRIKGNGDVVIQPNGYDVNFYEISVYNGNDRIAHWQVSDGDVTSLGWYLSPGSKWVRDTGTDYYYLEGGGFIAIPNLLNNNQLRVVVRASRDEGKLGQIKVNDHTMTVNRTSAQNYEWTLTDKYYKYVRVLNSSDLTAGEYLIVNEGESVIFDGSKGVLDAAYNNLNVEILDTHEILESALINNATFTIDPSAGTVKSASGYYIGWTASGNGLRQNATTPITNTITVDGIEAHIRTTGTDGTKELRYYNTSGAYGKRFRYYDAGTQQAIQLYKKVETSKPVGESVVRLGSLPIIDQFSVSVADNQHPNRYGYVLKYVPGANVDPNNEQANKAKTSSHIEVPVQKTASVVNGFYTVDDVEKDKDHYNTVKVDNITADMQMTLSNTNSAIFYYSILNKQEAVPHITADSVDYVSNLQNDNFVYQEMFKHSPNVGDRYNAGEHHYFDSVYVKGTYGKMGETYVPFITTRAIERFYFVQDSLHNTYGSPIWATSVGQVDVSQTTAQKQMKQVATENGGTTWVPNPSTSWTANGEDYTLYFLSVTAQGFLPDPAVSNVPYEPYMFRVFVESASGKLRKFEPVYGTNSQGQEIQIGLKDGGPITGKYCVGSYDINSGTWSQVQNNSYVYNFSKGISNDAPTDNDPGWSGNMMFGAPFNANSQSDFRVYVRFYYMKKGWNSREGNAPDHPANASERGQNPGSDTGIFEIFGAGTGEVVSTTYYNAQGMQSEKPFDGLNIVVTRYSNGTTSTTKVIR